MTAIEPNTLDTFFADNPDSGPPLMIRAEDVWKTYTSGKEETHALRGATASIYCGEYLSIMGPSGSGKSTFFNMIGGLAKPTKGKVFIDQVDIAQLDMDELAWLRCRKVGYIFQSYNLLQTMTCLENVSLPMSYAGLGGEEAHDRAIEILESVGLGERLLHKPAELSGGQQQRVAIARALANNPKILLADEPTANLDQRTGAEIIELFTELRERFKVTVISATHDLKMLQASDRIMWIKDGIIERIGTPDEIETH